MEDFSGIPQGSSWPAFHHFSLAIWHEVLQTTQFAPQLINVTTYIIPAGWHHQMCTVVSSLGIAFGLNLISTGYGQINFTQWLW